MSVFIELGVIFILLCANGVFAMAEIAVVASRKVKLKKLADAGNSGAGVAFELASSPNTFLATVQVGITLIGVLAGAVGGATLAVHLAKPLKSIPQIAAYSEPIALGIVVTLITYFSLVLGELLPKRLGLLNPERMAALLAKPMRMLSRVAAPLVRILSTSTDILLKMFPFKTKEEPAVSEDEVRTMVEQGFHAGVFHRIEHQMVEGVFRLDTLHVEDLLTPRARMVWLNVDDSDEVNWRKIVARGHSQFPVFEGNRDNVLGIVSVKALWANLALAGDSNLRNLVVPPLFVPFSMSATKLLETFKTNRKRMAIVSDEFGGIQGLVTLTDVLEAVVGQMPSEEESPKPLIQKREEGCWLCDASVDIDGLKRALGVTRLKGEESDEFETLAGFILYHLGHIPKETEKFECDGFSFEIIDMDRQRVDKVMVQRVNHAPPTTR